MSCIAHRHQSMCSAIQQIQPTKKATMTTETETKTDEWNPTTAQKVAAFVYTLASFRLAIAALVLGGIVGAVVGAMTTPALSQWIMYATIALVLWFNGRAAYNTATFPATGQRVYGFSDVEPKASAQARKDNTNA